MRTHRGRAPAYLLAAVLLSVSCGQPEPTAEPGTSPTAEVTAIPPTSAPSAAAPDPAEATPTPCDRLVMDDAVAVSTNPALTEISGAVISRRSPDAVWIHEDSANPTVLTEIGLDGTPLSRWTVPNIEMVDWEDIAAITDEDGTRWLIVGDIGDNLRRRDHLQLVRVPEPAQEDVSGITRAPVVSRLVMPDEPHDVEALVVDPATGDVVIVTKSVTGLGEIYVGSGLAWAEHGSSHTLESAGSLRLGPGQAVLAGDLSPDGTVLALRTPARVLLWQHDPTDTIAYTLTNSEPCHAPAVFDIQGEAIALLDEGYVLIGEAPIPELILVR